MLTRAGVAVGFTATPAVAERVDDAALALVCVVLAVAVWTALGLDWYARRELDRIELAVDGLSILVLVPTVALSGGLQVADGRFGGRLENIVAAFLTSVAVMFMLLLVSRSAPVRWPSAPIVALLPAALSAAVIFGGPGLFTTGRTWQGISLAWMVAALFTLLCAILPRQLRPMLALIAYAGVSLVVLVWSATSSGPNINTAANTLSIVSVVLIGVLVLLASYESSPRRGTSRRC